MFDVVSSELDKWKSGDRNGNRSSEREVPEGTSGWVAGETEEWKVDYWMKMNISRPFCNHPAFFANNGHLVYIYFRLPAFALCENNVTSEIVKSHELEIRTLANLSSLEVNKPYLWFLSYGYVFLFLSFYGALV